jgi:hypothetical protein
MKSLAILGAVLALTSFASPSGAQDVPAPYKEVLTFLGKQGDFKDNVLKVNIPRNDVSVTSQVFPRRRPSDSADGSR